jgi:signal transduction histidine kinase/CheY-like chemotaxis protein/HPt (histidine-containing phosphotransfer) domain-containing protein
MDSLLIIFTGICIIVVVYLIATVFLKPKLDKGKIEFDYDNIIQKKTYTLLFNSKGILISDSQPESGTHILNSLKPGEHINTISKIKNIDRYFESCLRFKKNITLKLEESEDADLAKRIDLIFAPVLEKNEVTSVMVISQELISKNREVLHLTKAKELAEQRNYALRQIDEIEAQRSELEIAFKKSSKHHIMLQKALRKIETQKDELEQALETINNQKVELERANNEIRESSRLKELFLANTSHEIRTPLNAIIGFTNLLLNSKLDEVQTKYLDNIKASGNNLLVVINDILDFSKIESGKLDLEQIDFDFRNMVKDAINTLQVKSEEKSIIIETHISPDIPEIIEGDPVRINQILINLLGNSLKFTDVRGSIKLFVTRGQSTPDKVKLLFKVQDNGIGISKDKLGQIFNSFTQGDRDTTRKYGGTGLGLSIVKQLIELHNGEISVESELGVGTSFTFYLILKEGAVKPEGHIKHQKAGKSQPRTGKINILLVEDNLINQQLAFDTIKSWNPDIHIDTATNGKIALEMVIAGYYDIILMDIQMPVLDGNEATQQIRMLDNPKSQTPIIAMTAHALKDEKKRCIQNGMNDYISKPFDPEELFEKINQYSLIDVVVSDPKIIRHEPGKPHQTEHEIAFKLFNVGNLKKIYPNSSEKIIKIVTMCYDSIPKEIEEIKNAYSTESWEILRNKAHALKPKLGYLGMETIQEKAKIIEIKSQQDEMRNEIALIIDEIENYWENAVPEIQEYISLKPVN